VVVVVVVVVVIVVVVVVVVAVVLSLFGRVDDRPDGVHLSYDKMASFLAPYRNFNALSVARDLGLRIFFESTV